jgi:hypothetical protein
VNVDAASPRSKMQTAYAETVRNFLKSLSRADHFYRDSFPLVCRPLIYSFA